MLGVIYTVQPAKRRVLVVQSRLDLEARRYPEGCRPNGGNRPSNQQEHSISNHDKCRAQNAGQRHE